MFIFLGLHISALTHLGEELVPQIGSSTLLLPEGVELPGRPFSCHSDYLYDLVPLDTPLGIKDICRGLAETPQDWRQTCTVLTQQWEYRRDTPHSSENGTRQLCLSSLFSFLLLHLGGHFVFSRDECSASASEASSSLHKKLPIKDMIAYIFLSLISKHKH